MSARYSLRRESCSIPHVSREVTQQVGESDLIVDHLVAELLCADGGESLVGPRVASNLVALGDHALAKVSLRIHVSVTKSLTLIRAGQLVVGSLILPLPRLLPVM